jgi:hypothetical protein
MNPDTPDFDNEDATESYVLSPQDKQLIAAAQSLLSKVARAPSLQPAQLVSVAKLQHALGRLPQVTALSYVHVSVSSPRRMFGDIETWHWWDVTIEDDSLRFTSGGHFYQPRSGGDTFTTMTWDACPGEESELVDNSLILGMVPDLRTYEDGVASVDFAAGEYSIEITDSDNPLLDEMGDDDEEIGEEDEDDEETDGEDEDEETVERVEYTVTPVDAAEAALAKQINEAEVNSHEADYAGGAQKCDFCQCRLDTRGLYVDGMTRADMSWANMCAPCFSVRGAGLGWGTGQLYARQPNGDWRLVAGFPPSVKD